MSVAISNKLRCLLVPSTNVVVFTGAGVSAESGVPTFRGKDGLWNEFNVQELATPQAFAANPVRVWEWYRWRMELISKVDPESRSLASFPGWSRFFSEFTLITQNVDGLHDRAGNQQYLQAPWGFVGSPVCALRARRQSLRACRPTPFLRLVNAAGALRPGVVWFGELLPEQEFSRSVAATEHCQLFFSVGTSAEVYPAAQLPMIAKENGAYVVEINIEPSALASKADEVLIGKAGEVLPLIQQSCTVLLLNSWPDGPNRRCLQVRRVR